MSWLDVKGHVVKLVVNNVNQLLGPSNVNQLVGHSNVNQLVGHSNVNQLVGPSNVNQLVGHSNVNPGLQQHLQLTIERHIYGNLTYTFIVLKKNINYAAGELRHWVLI